MMSLHIQMLLQVLHDVHDILDISHVRLQDECVWSILSTHLTSVIAVTEEKIIAAMKLVSS